MNQQDIETKVKDLLAKMTLAEKIGQMTQPEKNSVRPGDVAACWADPALAERLLGWRARRGVGAMCRDAWRWQDGEARRLANAP